MFMHQKVSKYDMLCSKNRENMQENNFYLGDMVKMCKVIG